MVENADAGGDAYETPQHGCIKDATKAQKLPANAEITQTYKRSPSLRVLRVRPTPKSPRTILLSATMDLTDLYAYKYTCIIRHA